MRRTGLKKLMFMTDSTVAMSSRVTCRRLGMPALLTSTSTPPSSSRAAAASPSTAWGSDRSHTHRTRVRSVLAAAGEHLVQPILAPGADAHGCPLSGELLGQSRTDAR